MFEASADPSADWFEALREHSFHFGGDFFTVLPSERQAAIGPAARRGIGIGAAADGDQGNGAGVIAFQSLLRETSPVTAQLVDLATERCAMAGIVCDHCAHVVCVVGCQQDWQRMIHRCGRIVAKLDPRSLNYAAVARKIDGALRPRKFPRPAILE